MITWTRLDPEDREQVKQWIRRVEQVQGTIALRNDLQPLVDEHLAALGGAFSPRLYAFLVRIQEVLLFQSLRVLLCRRARARYRVYAMDSTSGSVRRWSIANFLALKEKMRGHGEGDPLELDFEPFRRGRWEDPGRGRPGIGLGPILPQVARRFLARRRRAERRLRRFLGRVGILDGKASRSSRGLAESLRQGQESLAGPDGDWRGGLLSAGLGPGLGADPASAEATLARLRRLQEAPEPEDLQALVDQLPSIRRILLVSPHGWFAQEGVLGRPDTGGQVLYLLDQARALERELDRSLAACGWPEPARIAILTRQIPESEGTSCHLPRERIRDSERACLLRVPFRRRDGTVHPHWVSRFAVWPYLSDFAEEAVPEILDVLGGPPDLVVGNYSDGNLVATLLARRFGAVQGAVAHALEKSKYLFSELHWKDLEPEYHFSVQFTADLLAMNRADLVVTSSEQEIAGTETAVGQYESFTFFTMPGLYRVRGGIDLFDPRFHVIPPGVDEGVYFPWWEEERRDPALRREVSDLLFQAERPEIRGFLADPGRPPIFTLSRLDRIKNVTGLVEAYAGSAFLREKCNLVLITGRVQVEDSRDREERAEILRMQELLERHGLWDRVRWLGVRLPALLAGEAYRAIADRRGLFVQPALFEAFGLTVLEALASGLPTFATCFGGPHEILEGGRSGGLVNPTHPDLMAAELEAFLRRVEHEPARWDQVARRGVQRIHARYRWGLHASDLLLAARRLRFWKGHSRLAEPALRRYCHALRRLLLEPRIATVPRD